MNITSDNSYIVDKLPIQTILNIKKLSFFYISFYFQITFSSWNVFKKSQVKTWQAFYFICKSSRCDAVYSLNSRVTCLEVNHVLMMTKISSMAVSDEKPTCACVLSIALFLYFIRSYAESIFFISMKWHLLLSVSGSFQSNYI